MNTNVFTPSINIKRDFSKPINYIKTKNANRVYNMIVSNYRKGSRSFNLVGAYGVGKSAFIVALEQSLKGNADYYNRTDILNGKGVEFVNIVGESSYITETFAKIFIPDKKNYTTNEIIQGVNSYYNEYIDTVLVVVIDEFGKFLEYAAKNNPDKELYFIQQLAEFANDTDKDILFLTVLHKNFNAYSLNLTKTQIDEWNKVKGRIVEISFNEPVEQLLLLASEKINRLNLPLEKNNNINKLHATIIESKLFPFNDFNSLEFSKKLYPFDLLSASVLTLSLQEYAQNERSLFSFIENDDSLSLRNFDHLTNPFYNIANVYDYLFFHQFTFLSTKYNPHLNAWNSIKYAIEKIEIVLNDDTSAIKLVKAIGLLNIFSKKGGAIDNLFLENYARIALGINNPREILNKLIKNKILHFTKYDSRYKILEGTDLDFELAINEAGRLIERTKDVALQLNKYFNFPVIFAKRISYEKGAPRFFGFVLSEFPVKEKPNNDTDGIINLIFNEKISEELIIEESKKCTAANLYGFFLNTDKIERTLYEIEKIKKVIETNPDDKIAVKELKIILNHYKTLLNYYVIDSIYLGNENVRWYYKGRKQIINSQKEFNTLLSVICEDVFYKTPIFINELVNREKISGTISHARKNLFFKLLNNSGKIDFGFNSAKFPPEKTIFLSLIKHSGMYIYENGFSKLKAPTEDSLRVLWNESDKFFTKNITVKKKITDFIVMLKTKPFKLKQGFIDFWVPLFLVAHKNDFALYQKNRITGEMAYIPEINEAVLDLLNKSPQDFYVRKFYLSATRLNIFNHYRKILNQINKNEFSNVSFVETFRPFLVFYKSLPEFSKKTKQISKEAISLREAIIKSTDPEEVFFVNFPQALGYSLHDLEHNEAKVEEFVVKIIEIINEINSAYDKLLSEIEVFINEEIIGYSLSFPDNKTALQKRYKKINPKLLKPDLKIFYNRVNSSLVDRRSWINSLVQSLIGKSLENIKDDEIDLLKQKAMNIFRELDNYNELSAEDIDFEKEEVIKLEITSFLKGLSKKHIHIPKSKMKKISIFEKSIKEQLKDNDKTFKIALLTKLLQDELNDEKS